MTYILQQLKFAIYPLVGRYALEYTPYLTSTFQADIEFHLHQPSYTILVIAAMGFLSIVTAGITSYFAVTVSMFGLSIKSTRAGFVARCLAYYGCMVACASYGVVASVVLRIAGKPGISQWTVARAFKWTMFYTTGSGFDIIEGAQYLNTRPAVFLANHQTELDILLLGTIFPQYCSVTAKKSLKLVPFLGWFMALSGTVFIDRANRQTALKAFDGAAEEMRQRKQSVFIFPEGTRSHSTEPSLLPFKKGAFHLAVKAGVDIVPIVAENYAHRMNHKAMRFTSGSIRVKGIFFPSSHTTHVLFINLIVVLPPISTAGLKTEDIDKLTQTTRNSMLKAIEEMYPTRFEYANNVAASEKQPTPVPQATTTAIEI